MSESADQRPPVPPEEPEPGGGGTDDSPAPGTTERSLGAETSGRPEGRGPVVAAEAPLGGPGVDEDPPPSVLPDPRTTAGAPTVSAGPKRGADLPPPMGATGPPVMTADIDRGDALAVMFFLVVFGFSMFGIFGLLRGYWTDVVLALVFSALSRKPYTALVRLTGRPFLAATLTCLAIVVLVAVPTTFLAISLSAEAAAFIEYTGTSVSLDRLSEIMFGEGWVADRVRSFSEVSGVEITPVRVRELITGAAGALASTVYEGVNGFLTNVLSGLFHFLIIIALIFYLLVDGARFRSFVFRLSPLPDSHEELLLDRFGDVGRAILFGNGIGSAIQGVLGGAAMAAVDLPSPILWGTVMTIFAFLPVVGVTVVVIPATAYLALTGHPWAAIGFFTFCGVMALVVENVVKTRLMGSHMQMHDMLIFLGVIGGISAYGVLGLLYGPLLVTLFLTLADLYEGAYKHRIQDPLARRLGV